MCFRVLVFPFSTRNTYSPLCCLCKITVKCILIKFIDLKRYKIAWIGLEFTHLTRQTHIAQMHAKTTKWTFHFEWHAFLTINWLLYGIIPIIIGEHQTIIGCYRNPPINQHSIYRLKTLWYFEVMPFDTYVYDTMYIFNWILILLLKRND